MRVGGFTNNLRDGVMPLTLEFPGRPFELDVLLTDGKGSVSLQAYTAQSSLGGGSLTGARGAKLSCSEDGFSIGPLDETEFPSR